MSHTTQPPDPPETEIVGNDLTPTLVLPLTPGASETWPLDAVVEERYRVKEVRGGRGVSGMGVVYILEDSRRAEGKHADADRMVAAKTFQRQFAFNLSLVERFMREARAWLLAGAHPYIVRAYSFDIIDAVPYIFMEYVPSDAAGRLSLADHIAGGAIEPGRALRYAIQCCEGMIHATRVVPGLVHRDLKPENMLIGRDDTLKITDFGLVRCHIAEDAPPRDASTQEEEEEEGLTRMGSVFGTPAYMAPEQFVEAGTVTMAADIYAFGCCMYEVLSGKPPFHIQGRTAIERLLKFKRFHMNEIPAPLSERMPDCPSELNRVIMRCLEKAPTARWAGFQEIRECLIWIYEEVYGLAYTPTPPMDPSWREMEEQMISLKLLDAYERAIRMRNLRESQDTSPYAFHIALASFFHCQNDRFEERRQLFKAGHCRGASMGYEVARRLGDLLIAEHEFDEAGQLLNEFQARYPEGLDYVLEPLVHLLMETGRYQEAERLLKSLPLNLRTGRLRGELLFARQDWPGLVALGRRLFKELFDGVRAKLDELDLLDTPGWDYEGDWLVLREVLARLRPEWTPDTVPGLALLDRVGHVIWPSLTGSPDFGADMAWLSQGVGLLASVPPAVASTGLLSPEELSAFGACARLLDFPARLRHRLERDEYWLWIEENERNGAQA